MKFKLICYNYINKSAIFNALNINYILFIIFKINEILKNIFFVCMDLYLFFELL